MALDMTIVDTSVLRRDLIEQYVMDGELDRDALAYNMGSLGNTPAPLSGEQLEEGWIMLNGIGTRIPDEEKGR